MRFFDTHTHLCDGRFDDDREALVASLPEKGVALAVDVACELEQVAAVLALTGKYPFIYGAYGIHPHNAQNPGEGWEPTVRAALADAKAVALGEIGLDYHYDFSDRESQKRMFDIQLSMAAELSLPVVLHVREAYGDALDILRAHKGGLRGVMHCYSGSVETARECLDMGLYIALGGSVTFKNAKTPVAVAAYVPRDRLLIETDCPYMTPEPLRGRRNDPSLAALVARRIAAIRGEGEDDVAHYTMENGKLLFGIA